MSTFFAVRHVRKAILETRLRAQAQRRADLVRQHGVVRVNWPPAAQPHHHHQSPHTTDRLRVHPRPIEPQPVCWPLLNEQNEEEAGPEEDQEEKLRLSLPTLLGPFRPDDLFMTIDENDQLSPLVLPRPLTPRPPSSATSATQSSTHSTTTSTTPRSSSRSPPRHRQRFANKALPPLPASRPAGNFI